jgi:hypothetical protein
MAPLVTLRPGTPDDAEAIADVIASATVCCSGSSRLGHEP